MTGMQLISYTSLYKTYQFTIPMTIQKGSLCSDELKSVNKYLQFTFQKKGRGNSVVVHNKYVGVDH